MMVGIRAAECGQLDRARLVAGRHGDEIEREARLRAGRELGGVIAALAGGGDEDFRRDRPLLGLAAEQASEIEPVAGQRRAAESGRHSQNQASRRRSRQIERHLHCSSLVATGCAASQQTPAKILTEGKSLAGFRPLDRPERRREWDVRQNAPRRRGKDQARAATRSRTSMVKVSIRSVS